MRQKIKKCLTEQRGSITLLVLSTMLFMCVVLALAFTAISNKTSSQMKEIERIEAEYEGTEDFEGKYNEAINNSGPTTVTYNYSQNGGQSATASVKNVNYGSAIDLTPTASKSGYNFVGWNTDSNATTALTSLKMGDESVTLYAIYSKTVTGTFYYYNGTQSTSRTVSGTMYNNATTISIKSPTISSFTKDSKTHTPRGWSTSSSGSATISVSSGANVSLSANRTYYASYTYPITLTYNANGGSGGPTSQSGTAYMSYSGTKYNGSITLSTSKPTRTYYTFDAWYTSSTGGTKLGTTYSISSDTTIYAQWSGNVYTVTLNTQSATSLGSTAVYEKYNTGIYKELDCTNKMTTSSNAITKPTKSFTLTYNANGGTVSGTSTTASYTFGGYYTSSGGSGTQLINSNGYITSSFSTTRYTSNTTLYAKWTRNTISLATPTRAGYTFKGWFTSSSGGTQITSSSTITASRTIYAQWESNVEYIDNDGDKAVIPGGFEVVSGYDDVSEGLVISDEFDSYGNSIGNEFVWIPVKEVLNGTYPMASYNRKLLLW